jgi:PAS domain S-box-containing protein
MKRLGGIFRFSRSTAAAGESLLNSSDNSGLNPGKNNIAQKIFGELPDRLPAVRVALIYGILGGLWILFSDQFVDALTNDADLLSTLQTYKGLAYIVVSTLGLYALVLYQTRAIRTRQLRSNQQSQLQGVLADLGRRALELDELEDIYRYVLEQVAESLEVDLVKIARVRPSAEGGRVESGIALHEGELQTIEVPLSPDYLAGYVMEQKQAVLVERLDKATDFKVPDFLLEMGVKSSMVVPIINEEPIGVLGVHHKNRRRFDIYEANFLQSVANLLGQAIHNQQARQDILLQSELLDAVGQAVIATDPDGHIFYWNPAAESMYGWTSSEALGRRVFELTPAIGQDQRAARIMDQMRAGISWEGEFRLRRKDGREFVALIKNEILRDSEGEARAIIGITTDVTKIKNAQRALQRATDRLSILHQIDQQILAGETVKQMAEGVLQALADQLYFENGAVIEYELSQSKARSLANIGGPAKLTSDEWFALDYLIESDQRSQAGDPIVYTQDLEQLESRSGGSQDLYELGQRSLLVVRLKVGDESLGGLGLSRPEPNAFDEGEIELVKSVGDSLAVGLREAKLRQREKQRAQELEQLQNLSVGLVSELELDDLLTNITQAAFEFLSSDDAFLYLIDDSSGELRYAAGLSKDERPRAGTTTPRPNGVTRQVARRGKGEVIRRVAEHPKLKDEFEDWNGSLISQPILFHGQVLGVLNVGFDNVRDFSETELMILQLLTDMVAVAIHNAEQYRDLQRRQLESDALFRVTQRLSGQYQLNDVLQAVVYSIAEIIEGADAASLWLVEEEAEVLTPHAWVGHDEQTMQHLEIPRGASAVGRIFEDRLPLIIQDTQTSDLFEPMGLPEVDRIRSLIGVPIWIGQEVIGALFADSFEQTETFSQRDFRMLQLLGNQAATAIQRARLFSQVQAGRQRLEELSRQLVRVQEEERKNLARELHDEIGQLLTGLKLSLEMSQDQLVEGESPNLEEPSKIANTLLSQVRDLSLQLRPSMLDDLGLLPTLLWQVERSEQQLGLDVHFSHQDIEDTRFPIDVESTAFRFAQESLTNVARHAQTREAWLNVWTESNSLVLQVIDEGVGFEPGDQSTLKSASGLSGMQERARLLGGELAIESSPGEGATVTLELPLAGNLERRKLSRGQDHD